jgi:phosphate starvation-inducible membrane PsiE
VDVDIDEKGRTMGFTTGAIRYVENGVYAGLGILLCITALLALGSAGALLWEALRDWDTTTAMFAVIDRLLLVFMLIEILHTIRTSIQSHTLTCEPFLIVALIASIRRMLVITLQSAEVTREAVWSQEHEILFRSTMIELVVLGALILIMVASICLLRRSRGRINVEQGQVRPPTVGADA